MNLDSSRGYKVQRRGMKRLAAVFSVLVALLFSLSSAQAQGVIYAATGAAGIAGELYVVDIATEVETLIGPITNGPGGGGIGLTGIAFNPITDTLYGVTVNNITNGNTVRNSLVIIDPLTAIATVIGPLGSGISDISFAPDGTLYGFETSPNVEPRSLMTIALMGPNAGMATPVGATDLTSSFGGGLAFSPSGALYLSATGVIGTLDTLELDGDRISGPTLMNAPLEPGAIGALAFDDQGTLYGANNNGTGTTPVDAFLVRIDLNGVIGDNFPLPDNTDAIAWRLTPVPEASTTAMLMLGGAGCVALGFLRRRARR